MSQTASLIPGPASASASTSTSTSTAASDTGTNSTSSISPSSNKRRRQSSNAPAQSKLLDCIVEVGKSYDSPAYICYCVCVTDKELQKLTGKRIRHHSKRKQAFNLTNCPGYQQEVIDCYAREAVPEDQRKRVEYRFPGYLTYTNPVFPPVDRPVCIVIAKLPTISFRTIGGQQAGMDVEAKMVEYMDAAGRAKTLEKMAETLVEARKACAAIIERYPQDPRPMKWW